MIATKKYEGFVFFVFESGKIAKVALEAYATKTNRKKLTGAYSDKEKLAAIVYAENDETDILLRSSSGRMLLFRSSELTTKTSRNTQGVAVMKLKKGHRVISAEVYEEGMLSNSERYRSKTFPTMGQLPKAGDAGEQISFS